MGKEPSSYPPTGDERLGPIRVDYFGDEIDTITTIDTDTMGSGVRLDRVQLIGAAIDLLQSDHRTTNLMSLLPENTLYILNEMLELSEQARGYYERLGNPRGIYPPVNLFESLQARPHLHLHQYSAVASDGTHLALPVQPLTPFSETASEAIGELASLVDHGGRNEVVVLCRNEGEAARMEQLLGEHADLSRSIRIEKGRLFRGFQWREGETTLHLVPHHELFHRYDARRRIRRVGAYAAAGATDAFLEIAPGDHVVHTEHGIALFKALRTMKRQGKTEEYLTLEFAKGSLLHVPATQIDMIQKYVGGFQGRPPLSMLGGKRWNRQKQAAAEAVKSMAAEMLRIQAARAALPGVRYPDDTTWQREFEAEFPYTETDDQLAAIVQVKRDMETERPMDRLICGDVGFGKTEVAIRAAFKAVEFGRQAAVLVPTTVLAEQHERTIRQRVADYPFRVESVSRFKTAAEQKQVVKALASGEIDIIIGTHRLLSKDVHFKDLGLVIIDEEQRFGVEHKQRLLAFRLTAEVITLTATPIPRTLHMSLLGLRDISSLVTPPLDRRAVVTEVLPYDDQRIKQAIIRELNREGQVYFVHNRVHDIQAVADDIQKLVPEARIEIGHGQMTGRSLEAVMLRFVRRKIDVLVCTTIIESGIDIPTANTIIIDQADHFGLADLHQLRGRVGRYKHRAYCYLMLPKDRPITDVSARRLQAIEQFSMLGAGFKIAMRDLEIRGAGNLLGAEQSGHIAAIGYEMYCRMLEQEARRLKNEPSRDPVRTHLELPVTGRLPKRYISADRHRMEIYRRLSRAATLKEVDDTARDMEDAYGAPPAGARTLVELAELRVAAGVLQVEGLKRDGPDLIFRTRRPTALEVVLGDAPGRTSLIDERTVYYRPPANYLKQPDTLLAVLRKLLVVPAREGGLAAGEQVDP